GRAGAELHRRAALGRRDARLRRRRGRGHGLGRRATHVESARNPSRDPSGAGVGALGALRCTQSRGGRGRRAESEHIAAQCRAGVGGQLRPRRRAGPDGGVERMSRGHVCLVLHAHMPFIRHPEHEDFLEEGWLREAILETYIPLLWLLEHLREREVDYRITISLSPTLVAMLMDPLLRFRFERHLGYLCDLTEREVRRTRHEPALQRTANLYRDRFAKARLDYSERWAGDLVGAFRRLSDAGLVELITCSATHGFLPLLNQNPAAVRAQILVGVQHHRDWFGAAPAGLWLPECGYFAGLDRVLAEAGVRYTFVETHAIDHAPGQAYFGVYAPLCSP